MAPSRRKQTSPVGPFSPDAATSSGATTPLNKQRVVVVQQQLEVTVQMLQERVRTLEQQKVQDMEERANLIAKNRRLQRALRHNNEEVVVEEEEEEDPRVQVQSAGLSVAASPTVDTTPRKRTYPVMAYMDSSDDDEEEEETEEGSGMDSVAGLLAALDSAPNAVAPPKKKRGRPRKSTGGTMPSTKSLATPKPPSVKLLPWRERPYDPDLFFLYPCPIAGCRTNFAFKKTPRPPLTADGQVSDQQPWPNKHFVSNLQKVRSHMRTAHADFGPEDWPPGFAFVRPRHPSPKAKSPSPQQPELPLQEQQQPQQQQPPPVPECGMLTHVPAHAWSVRGSASSSSSSSGVTVEEVSFPGPTMAPRQQETPDGSDNDDDSKGSVESEASDNTWTKTFFQKMKTTIVDLDGEPPADVAGPFCL